MNDVKPIKDLEIHNEIYEFSGFCPHCNEKISGNVDIHSDEYQCEHCNEWVRVDVF